MKIFKITELEPTGEWKGDGGVRIAFKETYHLHIDVKVTKKELNTLLEALGKREEVKL